MSWLEFLENFYKLEGGCLRLTDEFRQAIDSGGNYLSWNQGDPLSNFRGRFEPVSIQGLFMNLNMKHIDISWLDFSNVTDACDIFKGCKKLESVVLPFGGWQSIQSLRGAFSGCASLELLDLGGINFPDLENIYEMCVDCTSLEYVNLSHTIMNKLVCAQDTFMGCNKLRFLDVENWSVCDALRLYVEEDVLCRKYNI